MKKLLLSCAAVAAAFSMSAADITESFATVKNWDGMITAKADATVDVNKVTSPETGIEYSYSMVYGSTYLMFFNDKADNLAYVEFSLPIDCSIIVIGTTSSLSTKDTNAVNVYADDNLIAENVKINVKSSDVNVVIPDAYQKAGTVYKFQGTTKGVNNQILSMTYKEASSEATLLINSAEENFAAVKGAEQEKVIAGVAANLEGNITITCTNAAFEVASSCTAAEFSAGIPVTFKPAAAGAVTATLTFTSGALTATCELSAYAAAHEGTSEDPLTVEDVIGMNNGNVGPYCVTGKIAGCADNIKAATEEDPGNPSGVTDTFVASNIALTQEGIVASVPVQLASSSEARAALNLVDNPDMLGKDVIISGELVAYFGRPGVQKTKYIGTTGIENVAVEAVEGVAEYYNLQGVRVAQPAQGLYIVRCGNKVSKVLVK